jgi:hypothetical protein
MSRIEKIKELIKIKQTQIDDFELDPYNYEEQYCEMLDCEGDISVGGIEFSPSEILSKLDPIAYRCGLLDYVDCYQDDLLDNSEEYNDLKTELEELEYELEELEYELEEEE